MAMLKQRGAPQWEMDPDTLRGFTTSVRNGQIRMALEYAEVVISNQQKEIDALKVEVAETKSMVMDLARTSTSDEQPRRGPGRPPKVAMTPDSTQGTSDLAE